MTYAHTISQAAVYFKSVVCVYICTEDYEMGKNGRRVAEVTNSGGMVEASEDLGTPQREVKKSQMVEE